MIFKFHFSQVEAGDEDNIFKLEFCEWRRVAKLKTHTQKLRVNKKLLSPNYRPVFQINSVVIK